MPHHTRRVSPCPSVGMCAAAGKRSFFNWLFRGSRRPFEIVLIDHGTYLTLTREMREQFCELWCSFIACDRKVQLAVSIELAGELAGPALPTTLTYDTTNR